MKTILHILKDQGGQFWGAFSQSLAQSLKEERDRPLKEAMLKAEIGQKQALAQKMQMDLEQERQRNQALGELTQALQPKPVTSTTYDKPFAALEQTGYGETNPPAEAPDYGERKTTTMKAPNVNSPEVMGALVKAQPKEAANKLLQQFATSAVSKFGVDTLEEAQAMSQDPNFRAMFPHGHRWEVKNGKLVPSGINPVEPIANMYHLDLEKYGPEVAKQNLINNLFGKSNVMAQGGVSGKTSQQLGEPGAPIQPIPGQPSTYPATGTPPYVPPTTPQTGAGVIPQGTQPTESPTMRVERQKKDIARQEQALPEGEKKRLQDAQSVLDSTQSALNEIEANPGVLESVGPFASYGAKLQETFGETPVVGGMVGGPLSQSAINLRQYVGKVRNVIRHSEFGAALTAYEAAAAEEELASIEKSPTSATTRLRNIHGIFSRALERMRSEANVSRGEAGRRFPTPAGAPATQQQPGKFQPTGTWRRVQ